MLASPEQVFEQLAGVRAALTQLIDALEAQPCDDAVIQAAQQRAEALAQTIGNPSGLRAIVPPAEHPRLRAELEDWLRLVSLASASCVRTREAAESTLSQVRSGRRSLDALESPREPGHSCDLSA